MPCAASTSTSASAGSSTRTRSEPTYIGRFGLADPDGRRLLVDWRSPAAEPFFAATHAQPHGLVSRRRYRWTNGRIVDYWDEAFTEEGLTHTAALDDQSAFIATLGGSRTERMRDVLGTIQADQDAIVRAGSRGALVVDGGPGTGKTVVALHRTAYLLYADPRLGHRRGGVLFVGPHQPYLAYVGDVLPSLGEEGVQTCTIRDLVPETAVAVEDDRVAALKADVRMVAAIEPAVALYEEPPTEPLLVETPWGDVRITTAEWAEAFDSPDPGTPHNLARDDVWDEVLTILADKLDSDELTSDDFRRVLDRHRGLRDTFDRAWPLIEHTDLVGDLWTVPAYLRRCAPWLEPDEVQALRRSDPEAWTDADLPLLDAARLRLGDPEESRRRRRTQAAEARERARMSEVIDDLRTTARESGADEFGDGLVSMLVHDDLQTALVDDGALPAADVDLLAGPFAHVVVDEAQELTDAEWQMLLRRCPSRSLTIVGDRAQARHGFTESWTERLERIGLAGRDRRAADGELPHARRGDGRGRARHPRGAAGGQRADLDPRERHPGAPLPRLRARRDHRGLAGRARRGHRCCHRRPDVRRSAACPLADAPAGEGPGVRPRRARRPRPLRRRRHRRGRPLRRDDEGDPAARRAHLRRVTRPRRRWRP